MERQRSRLLQLQTIYIVVAVVSLAVLFSSFTLWLVESWIKYPLFLFEIFAIITIYPILKYNGSNTEKYNYNNNNDYGFKVATIKNVIVKILDAAKRKKLFQGFFLDIFLIAFSAFLIVFNGLHIEGWGIIQLFLAFISTSILSGYALLNIFRITKYLSKLEVLVLSYLSSFIFSGFSTLVLLSIDENTRSFIMPFFFISVGILSALVHIKNKDVTGTLKPLSFSNNIDILAIALSIIFYIIFFYYTYPNFTLLPSTDISRHYDSSIILSRTPDLYNEFSEILFHAFQAALYNLSGFQQSITSFQSIQIILNVFLPIAVYIFAKRFLGNLDRRIPAISTIFYTILSNFSFIYFTQLKLLNTGSEEIQILGQDVAEKSFNGTINFLQPFAWFVPLSVSFILFIMAFLLLRVRDIPRSRFVPLFSVLVLAMYLTHVTEAVIFVIFIGVYSFISRNNSNASLRLDDALLSSFIGFILASVFVGYTSFAWTSELGNVRPALDGMLAVILPLLFVSASMLWRWKVLPKIPKIAFIAKLTSSKKFYPVLSASLAIIYLFGFLTWIFIEDFRTSTINDIGVVPWFIYPLMLGILGLLAILSVRYLGDILPNSSVAIILASIVFMFLIGRIISFVNLNFLLTGYWEKRFLLNIFVFVSLLAPIPLLKFVTHAQMKIKRKLLANSFLVVLVSLIIVSGFSSTVLQSEYWSTAVNSDRISEKELQALSYLKNILQRDPRAFMITPSKLSYDTLALAAPAYVFSLPQVAISSKYPDVPLLTLAAHNLKHAYLYIPTRDIDILNQQPQSWLAQHLIPMLPVVFSNGEVTIYNATHVSFPLPNSDTTMIIPSNPRDNSWLYAYDVISQSGKNYTIMYDKDTNALKSKNVILSFDPTDNSYYLFLFSKNNLNQWNDVISGSWKYSSDGLHGGDQSNNPERTILSPVVSKNSNISTLFRVSGAEPHVPSYVSVVHSWIDPKNYEYAGIMIYNNAIYVSFVTVSNGVRSFDPIWPGVMTNLKWKPGDIFNITLSMQGNNNSQPQQELFLNGTRYLHRDYNVNKYGYLGLSYGRTQDVVFSNFKIQESEKNQTSDIKQQELSNYMKYVKSGGHLVVLDTNGYGSIANSLFNITDSSKLMSNNSNNHDSLSSNEKLIRIRTTGNSQENDTPISFYASTQGKASVFEAEANVGQGNITYINIYPILSNHFNNKKQATEAYMMLGKISKILDLSPHDSPPLNFKNIPAIFREMTGSGNIDVKTSSLVYPSYTTLNEMRITTSDHKNIVSLANITNLNIDGYRDIVLHLDHNNNISLTNGKGLYSDLVLKSNNTSAINFILADNYGNPKATTRLDPTISGISGSKRFHFDNVSNIMIINKDPIHVYVRQPNISINNGNATFNELYSNAFYATGQNVKVSGAVYLSVDMSDSYTLASHISMHGSIQKLTPVSPYNAMTFTLPAFSISKLYSLPVFVRVLMLIPFLLTALFILYGPSKKSKYVSPT